MRRSRSAALLRFAVFGLVAGFAVGVPSVASANTCLLDADAHHLDIVADDWVWLRASNGNLEITHVECGSLSDIDTVTVDMTARPNAGVTIDLGGGPLGPGYTDEGDGSSEIEIEIVGLGGAWGDDLEVRGSSDDDGVTLGGNGPAQVNVNALADGATPDVDVTLDTLPDVGISGGEGDDIISGAGVLPGDVPYANRMGIDAGPGNNTVSGGTGNDEIGLTLDAVNTGQDVLTGGGGRDTLNLYSELSDLAATYSLDGAANDGVGCPGSACEGDNIGDDFLIVNGSMAAEHMIGNDGPQYLSSDDEGDLVEGLGGADRVTCMGGRAFGGAGNDVLPVSVGCREVSGGPGWDQSDFVFWDSGVHVTLDDVPDDGVDSSLLNMHSDVEVVYGTGYSDLLIGDNGRNVLRGTEGADVLRGAGGDDRLEGGQGDDNLAGQFGDDRLNGRGGDDTLDGGDGVDLCRQGTGTGTSVDCE